MSEATSSTSKKPCNSDDCKNVGIFKCEGCSQIFCRKHANEHRDRLNCQLDNIVLEHDSLQQMITEQENHTNNQSLFNKIERWERDSIVKIQQAANEARQKVNILIKSQTELVTKELHNITETLRKARMNDDFVETDLRKWTDTIEKLKQNVSNVLPSVNIIEDSSKSFISRILFDYTAENREEKVEKFVTVFGNIFIADNGSFAYHHGHNRNDGFVRGIKEYSSGKYKLQFIMNKTNTNYCTAFGIISVGMGIPQSQDNLEKICCGWNSNDSRYFFGTKFGNQNIKDMKDEKTLEIQLFIDCANQKIGYFNDGTKNTREMDVDTTKCPLPWNVLFYLYDIEDSVRIISSTKLP